jgi:hypothetical protein
MARALVLIGVLAVLAADYTVGCGQGYVYGPVDQKYATGGDTGSYLISVNGTPYEVPMSFYYSVRVGDVVKFDGRSWSVVKQAPTTVGSPPSPPSSSTP